MAGQENLNLFALLGDEAEDNNDILMLIEIVVKVDPRLAAEEKRRKKKKNMEAEKPIGINLAMDSINNNNNMVNMRAKRIVLPEHVASFQHGSRKPCNIIFAFTSWLIRLSQNLPLVFS